MERKLSKSYRLTAVPVSQSSPHSSGYLEKEIKKDGIPMLDIGDNPEAPQPREMIDLEVRSLPSVANLTPLTPRLIPS